MNENSENPTPFDPVAAAVASFDEPNVTKPEATLERLRDLAKEMQRLEKEIADDSVLLAEKQGMLDKISGRIIPDIMEELAMESFTLADGSKLEVKDDIKASITEENRPAAHAWLREHNFDGIIKTKVMVEFGKGEMDKAEAAQKALLDNGYDASMSEAVHPATLKSFVKERMEAGDSIPVTTFGVFEFKKTKITAPRKPRAAKR